MKITYYGHACFAVETGGKTILFDPFISGNPLASGVSVADIKPDYIAVSHGHTDHIADVMGIALQSGALLISNFEIVSWFAKKGLTHGRAMNHGGHAVFDFGTIRMVNAVHSSSMPDGAYGGNPCGFIVTSGDNCIYFSGDTDLMPDMKMFGEMFNIDVAILSLGDNFTMNAADAAIAAHWLKAGKVFGSHFDTFDMIKISHEKAKEAFAQKNIPFILPEIGKTY